MSQFANNTIEYFSTTPLCTLSKLKLTATSSISCQDRKRLLLFVFVVRPQKIIAFHFYLYLSSTVARLAQINIYCCFRIVFVFVISSCNVGPDPSRLSLPVATNKCNVRFSELLPSAFTRSKEAGLQQVINCPT